MKLKTESYRGVSIRVVNKILSGRNWVVAHGIVKGKKFEFKGNTKDSVVAKAKQIINKILG